MTTGTCLGAPGEVGIDPHSKEGRAGTVKGNIGLNIVKTTSTAMYYIQFPGICDLRACVVKRYT